MIVIMDRETFDQLMLEEWQQDVLKTHQPHCDTSYFNMLWDLRDRLYDFFYPLGISGCGIHDVARIAADFDYSEHDDGDLSIVIARTQTPKDQSERFVEFVRKHKPDYEPKPSPAFIDIFVMFGHHCELTHEKVKHEALRHRPLWEFVGYDARPFNIEVLKGLHSLVPRFEEERRLAQDDAREYFKYAEMTKTLLEQMILEQKG